MEFSERYFSRSFENWNGIKIEDFLNLISSKCQYNISIENLEILLKSDKQINIKLGIDPTFPNLHFGHVVPIMLLKQFLRIGQRVDLVIGDFTAKIGDPSERIYSKSLITEENIIKNMLTYKSQIGKFVDINSINIHYNSDWLRSVSVFEMFKTFKHLNLTNNSHENDIRNGVSNIKTLSLSDICYPSLMGIDSVHLFSDIEIGGVDQLYNFIQCRQIMKSVGIKEEVVLMTPMLSGISGGGKKMSKSLGNTIDINDSSEDKFGKIMSINDSLIEQFYLSFADLFKEERKELSDYIYKNPLEAKKQLATLIVALDTLSMETALICRELFERKYSKKKIYYEDCLTISCSKNKTYFEALWLSLQFNSKHELKQIFNHLGVRIKISDSSWKILSINDKVSGQCIIKVGKRKFFTITTD